MIATDSLDAVAVRRRSSVGTAAVRSLGAGADLMLLAGQGSVRPTVDALYAAARRSATVRARVRAAAARVMALKARYSPRNRT